MVRYLVILTFFLVIPCHAYCADALVLTKKTDDTKLQFNIKNVKVLLQNDVVSDDVIIEGNDGSKLSIPFSAVKAIYFRNKETLVRTKTGKEYLLPSSQNSFSTFTGDNQFGGTTSFTSQYLVNMIFR